jgi:hypothetical protein
VADWDGVGSEFENSYMFSVDENTHYGVVPFPISVPWASIKVNLKLAMSWKYAEMNCQRGGASSGLVQLKLPIYYSPMDA